MPSLSQESPVTRATAADFRSQFTARGIAGYLLLLVGGVGGLLMVQLLGQSLQAPELQSARPQNSPQSHLQVDVILHVLATLSAVVVLGQLLRPLLRILRQPPVIGEMAAGILLGPSLLGLISPAAMQMLIPSATDDPRGLVPTALQAIAQLGIVLYMFLVGLELNATRVARRAHTAVAVSHVSIVLPFVMGAVLALVLYPLYADPQVPFSSFSLFLGVAVAITAFPVLARILADRGLQNTDLGDMALSCAAADDVTAWCLLALVVGIVQTTPATAVWVIAGAAGFIAFMIWIARPAIQWLLARRTESQDELPSSVTSIALVTILLAALATEAIGIHAIFGAFLLGAIIPHDSQVARELTLRLRTPVSVLLLPAFFACTGMRTEISLLNGVNDWAWCGVIILVATIGKFGGTFVAALFTGWSVRESAALGTLMNTRGLMELIVLNIGLDLGIISPTLFAMMVIMALTTTAVTGPLLSWILRSDLRPAT